MAIENSAILLHDDYKNSCPNPARGRSYPYVHVASHPLTLLAVSRVTL